MYISVHVVRMSKRQQPQRDEKMSIQGNMTDIYVPSPEATCTRPASSSGGAIKETNWNVW